MSKDGGEDPKNYEDLVNYLERQYEELEKKYRNTTIELESL